MLKPHRHHPLWFAFIVHRLSGVCLALFLPAHFYVLGLALNNGESLDRFLHWTEHPLLRWVEFGLVFCLAVHMFGGVRLLALEFMPWSPKQKTFAALAAALSLLVACLFLLRAT
ncbi:MAG: succinate dehydrogenase, cytochrome b556 subunit [Arenicellales bacterium]|nr:succinate dehydrogenase, cytochrome b556 subunit [Arenicellales bacterium]